MVINSYLCIRLLTTLLYNKMTTSEIISKGFESWINERSKDKVSVLIDYSDKQNLSIKAYHKTHAGLVVIGTRDSESYTETLASVDGFYNHGVTTESEAKEQMLARLVKEMFSLYGDTNKIICLE